MNKIDSKRRFVSLWFPLLPLEIITANMQDLSELPLCIYLSNNKDKIICTNQIAKNLGVKVGMSPEEALILNPKVINKMIECQELKEKLIDFCDFIYQFTPTIGLDSYDGLILDITGCKSLTENENKFANHLIAYFFRRKIFSIVGIASSQGAAWAVTRFNKNHIKKPITLDLKKLINDQSRATRIKTSSNTKIRVFTEEPHLEIKNQTLEKTQSYSKIIKRNQTREALLPLPIESLRLKSNEIKLLNLFGIYSVMDLMNIDRNIIARKFGGSIVERTKQALGEKTEILEKLPFIKRYFFSYDIDQNHISFEIVSRIVKSLIENLCLKLYIDKKLIRKCVLRFLPDKNFLIEANFTNATQDQSKIKLVILEQLESLKNLKHTELITLEGCLIENLLEEQTSLSSFEKHGTFIKSRKKEKLSLLLARVEGKLGKSKIRSFIQHHSHVPEKTFSLKIFEPQKRLAFGWRKAKFTRPILLYKPNAINVAEYQDNCPRKFNWKGKKYRTVNMYGPERISPEWWIEKNKSDFGLRDYWNVETACGTKLWMFQLKNSDVKNKWFVHGNFC